MRPKLANWEVRVGGLNLRNAQFVEWYEKWPLGPSFRRCSLTCVAALWLAVGFSSPAATAGPNRIRFEIYTEKSLSPLVTNRWLDVIKDFSPAGVRISRGRGGEKPKVVRTAPNSFLVTGIVTARNQLTLPGATFGLRDAGRLSRWLEQIDKHADATDEEKFAFGLTADELVAIYETLSRPVMTSTRGRVTGAVVAEIAESVKPEVVYTQAARRALAAPRKVQPELKTVSQGTALAALLLPLDLSVTPNKDQHGEVFLNVQASRESNEAWPVGWPSDKSRRELLPKLLDSLEVEIAPVPLSDSMAALEKRFEVPFVWDEPNMRQHRIEPATKMVAQTQRKILYARLLSRLLFQARMKYELRVDEAGQPLLFLTPI